MQLDFIEAPCFRCGKMEIEASRRNYHVPPSNTPYTDAVEREYWTEMWRRDAVEGDEDTVFRAQRILEVIGASLQNVLGTIRNGLPPPAESEHVPVVDGGEVNMEEVNSGEVNGEVSMADSD